MSRHPSGTVCWVGDPTDAHADRPAVVLAHDTHPFGATDYTIMCIGTSANKYQNQYIPEVKDIHLKGISLSKQSYFMPWSLYTIPPSPIGQLTAAGEKEVKKSINLKCLIVLSDSITIQWQSSKHGWTNCWV